MNTFFKKWRKENLGNFKKYLIYALGEILLIITGILIAVNINTRQSNHKDNVIRCEYLEDLKFAFEKDLEDVEINVNSFRRWNPKVKIILEALDSNNLSSVDSLNDKITAISNYVTFLQQSKSKIEELKYSNINLITNRDLKNKVLMYHETKITFLLEQQRRFNQTNDKVEDYFLQKKILFTDQLVKDEYFYKITEKKLGAHETMLHHYDGLYKELEELILFIETELKENC